MIELDSQRVLNESNLGIFRCRRDFVVNITILFVLIWEEVRIMIRIMIMVRIRIRVSVSKGFSLREGTIQKSV